MRGSMRLEETTFLLHRCRFGSISWFTTSVPIRSTICEGQCVRTRHPLSGRRRRKRKQIDPEGENYEKRAVKMTDRVALDDKTSKDKGQKAQTWMEAAGRNGIPSAFLVDKKGIIAWIGHPMELKDSIIGDVLAGKFDVKKAADDSANNQKNEAQLHSVWE